MEIFIKIRLIWLYFARFGHRRTGRSGLVYRRIQMYLRAMTGRKMILYIALIDEAQNSSSRTVACFNVARLERGLECQRREGKYGLLSQAYA